MNRKSIVAFVAATIGVQAQVQINEIFMNPPGSDNTVEFIEFKGAANQALTGLHFLLIEGDSTSSGFIDQALDLSSLSLGSNGLLLWRDNSLTLSPAPASGTTVHTVDFSPDIENTSNTYLIVSGFTGTVGSTLDANLDGVLDSTPWTSVVDAIGLTDGGGTDFIYAASLGGYSFPALTFIPDALIRLANDGGVIVAADVTGTTPGPFLLHPTENSFSSGTYTFGDILGTAQLTPGSENIAVPEPQEYAAIAGVLALGAAAWRRRANRA